MIKHSILFLLLFAWMTPATYAQETVLLKGKVVRSETLKPLGLATLVYPNKSLGFEADDTGEFSFYLTASPSDSLEIRHLGYEVLKISIADFLTGDRVIKLKDDEVALAEVVIVSRKDQIDATKLMKRVYKLYAQNKPKEPHIAKSYFRETGILEGEYVFFNESRGYSIFMGQRKDAALFSNYKFFPEQSRISNVASGFKVLLENAIQERNGLDLSYVGFSNNENNYRRFQEYGPLSKRYHSRFDYQLDSTYINNGVKYYKVGFNDNQLKGAVVVNGVSLQLLEATYETDELISNPFTKSTPGQISLAFRYINEVPYLSEMTSKSTHNGLEIVNYLKTVAQKFRGFDLSENQYWGFNMISEHFYISYSPEEWLSIPYYSNPEFKAVESDLKIGGKDLEEQFTDHSGAWMNTPTFEIGAAKNKIKELEVYFN
ncbi:carboxypeptidase-like regulatory domain-containing protein [Leeuwenhoekiella marinoflava]|uniref:carboxypeptidase-like regulatory domain-containing protein n=1 Tax=Leeuwenhoekiella marinoflava TaxID=988 RepID=UPI003001FCD9